MRMSNHQLVNGVSKIALQKKKKTNAINASDSIGHFNETTTKI